MTAVLSESRTGFRGCLESPVLTLILVLFRRGAVECLVDIVSLRFRSIRHFSILRGIIGKLGCIGVLREGGVVLRRRGLFINGGGLLIPRVLSFGLICGNQARSALIAEFGTIPVYGFALRTDHVGSSGNTCNRRIVAEKPSMDVHTPRRCAVI